MPQGGLVQGMDTGPNAGRYPPRTGLLHRTHDLIEEVIGRNAAGFVKTAESSAGFSVAAWQFDKRYCYALCNHIRSEGPFDSEVDAVRRIAQQLGLEETPCRSRSCTLLRLA
jgi:hypothetical protein